MTEPREIEVETPHGAEDGWVVASTPEVLGAMSQGQTRDEARANVIDALQLILSPEVGRDEAESADRERHLREHGCRLIDEGRQPQLGGPLHRAIYELGGMGIRTSLQRGARSGSASCRPMVDASDVRLAELEHASE